MLGFNNQDEAKSDYLANYENGWENGRRIDVTAVNLEDFEKWIESSKRKTKAFSEYKNVKSESAESPKTGAFGTIYTQFRGKAQEAIAFEKKNSVSDNTTDTVGTAEGGKRNGTATPQNTVSDGKDTEKDSSEQGNEEKKASGDRPLYASLGVSRSLGEDAAEGEPRYASSSLSEQQLDGDKTRRKWKRRKCLRRRRVRTWSKQSSTIWRTD